MSPPCGLQRLEEEGVVSRFDPESDFLEESKKILGRGGQDVPPFWVQKYRKEACKNWDRFYKRNQANFFKNRNYLSKEFQEVEEFSREDLEGEGGGEEEGRRRNLLIFELGCGVGNALLPLVESSKNIEAAGVDCSETAVNILKTKKESLESEEEEVGRRLLDFGVADISSEIPTELMQKYENKADFVLLMFVLSAIPPEKQENVIFHAKKLLKKGGILFFRDYGKFDLAELRFAQHKQGARLGEEDFYVRQDGTMAKFFEKEDLRRILGGREMEEVELKGCLRKITNRKTGVGMKRIWLQGKWKKV